VRLFRPRLQGSPPTDRPEQGWTDMPIDFVLEPFQAELIDRVRTLVDDVVVRRSRIGRRTATNRRPRCAPSCRAPPGRPDGQLRLAKVMMGVQWISTEYRPVFNSCPANSESRPRPQRTKTSEPPAAFGSACWCADSATDSARSGTCCVGYADAGNSVRRTS